MVIVCAWPCLPQTPCCPSARGILADWESTGCCFPSETTPKAWPLWAVLQANTWVLLLPLPKEHRPRKCCLWHKILLFFFLKRGEKTKTKREENVLNRIKGRVFVQLCDLLAYDQKKGEKWVLCNEELLSHYQAISGNNLNTGFFSEAVWTNLLVRSFKLCMMVTSIKFCTFKPVWWLSARVRGGLKTKCKLCFLVKVCTWPSSASYCWYIHQ